MRDKFAQLFIFFLVSVFTFNLVADCVSHHNQESSTYCCDLNEVEEVNELESRIRLLEPLDLVVFSVRFNFIQEMFADANISASLISRSRAFFPHALHVPIYLDKCTFLV